MTPWLYVCAAGGGGGVRAVPGLHDPEHLWAGLGEHRQAPARAGAWTKATSTPRQGQQDAASSHYYVKCMRTHMLDRYEGRTVFSLQQGS